MAHAARHRGAHRKASSLPTIMISKENRNRALAVVGSGAALTLIASTAGAAVNGKTGVDVSASAKHMTKAVAANKAVVGADVAWSADDASADSQGDVAEVSEKRSAPVAASTGGKTSGYVPPQAVAAGSIVATAMQYVGAPYVSGGTSPSGFDCSGFVQFVYGLHGISLPRTTWGQGAAGTHVSAADAKPGDIVYYGYHVGIYVGNGMMVDAGNPRVGVAYRAVFGSPSYIRIG